MFLLSFFLVNSRIVKVVLVPQLHSQIYLGLMIYLGLVTGYKKLEQHTRLETWNRT